MGKREKRKAKLDLEEEGEAELSGSDKPSNSFLVLSSDDDDDDDEAANEDLSLKIVEKALLMRAAKLVPDAAADDAGDAGVLNGTQGAIDGGGNGSSSSVLEGEVVESPSCSGRKVVVPFGSNKKIVKKKKKIKKTEVQDQSVVVVNDKEEEETVEASNMVEPVDPNAVEITDNIVFRKLLRGPRYFDPPDSGWGACFNCGEEGHTVANCTAAKRKKPCFVCGSLEHNAKQCSKGQDCFICKKSGHRAKDCPEKYKGGSLSLKICLKCGGSGHDMFSCWNDYSHDDLKGIQCYICKRLGHLCCIDYVSTSPGVISCYKCGQLGHTGLACTKVRGEASGMVSSSSCYKCGEEGHFARECTSSARASKRSHELSTQTLRFHREERDYSEFKSLPKDLGKVRKKKTKRNEEQGNTTPRKSKRRGGRIMEDFGDISTPQNSKHRGGWITEDPGDFSHRKAKKNSWKSPATPSNKGHTISTLTAGSHISSSRASEKSSKFHSGTSMSQRSPMAFQHRFSASRFDNSGSDGMQRNYNWC